MITQAELKELLDYDPETGIFRWNDTRNGKVKIGDIAGWVDQKGYIQIKLCGSCYRAHRLAFLYMDGYFPEHQVDHLDGIRDSNKWRNLRHVTGSCNLQNTKKYASNTSGFPGVSWSKRSAAWISRIEVTGKSVCIGFYPTPLEAALARYTVEVWCPKWTCNHRSVLVQAIKEAWPEFKPSGE